jgi:hypothetical protein
MGAGHRVQYVRINPPFNASAPSISRFYLTTPFDLENVPGFAWADFQGNLWTGDYMAGAARGCIVYFGFMSRHENNVMSVYVSRINICPPADIDADGQVTAADSALFWQYYTSNDPRSDVTRDGTINAADVSLFTESYACACTP